MKAIPGLALLLLAALLASCSQRVEATASSGTPKRSDQPAKEKDFGEWASGLSGGGGYTKDEEGNLVPKEGSRRSSFDRKDRDSPYFKKGPFSGTNKEYATKDYAKKSWWGNKDYGVKEYAGKTDGNRFHTDSLFGSKTARDGDKVARDAGKSAREGNGFFATKSAREANGRVLDHPSDAETDSRRRVFTPPSVISWEEQRKLSVQQVKGILGRE